MSKKLKEKIARYCPKCGIINWVSVNVQTTRKAIKCGNCKVQSGFWEWGLTAPNIPRCKAKGYNQMEIEAKRQEDNKLKASGYTDMGILKLREDENKERKTKYPLLNSSKGTKSNLVQKGIAGGIWLYCPHCDTMRFKEHNYDSDFLRCTSCTFVRKLTCWLTEGEWKAKQKRKTEIQGTAQRLMYCPACNEKKWISTNLFKPKDMITCIQCKRKLPMSAYRMTENPKAKKFVKKPPKQMKVPVLQRHYDSPKEIKLTVDIDESFKGNIAILAKHELMIVLLVLDTEEIMLSICHKKFSELVLELRVCDNIMSKAKNEIEDMLKKMYTGKNLRKFISKRARYIMAKLEKRLVKA